MSYTDDPTHLTVVKDQITDALKVTRSLESRLRRYLDHLEEKEGTRLQDPGAALWLIRRDLRVLNALLPTP